jgi:lipopolysaccharide heptosyltransferase II
MKEERLATPEHLLLVMPSWVGDAAMAVPALRAVRAACPQARLTALCRPGIEAVLEGCPLLDDCLVGRPRGLAGTWALASRLRRLRCDAALLLPNSFKTALLARLAGIPQRLGYQRDGRGWLLTRGCPPPRRADGGFATVPAVRYYLDLVRFAFPELDEPSQRLELWTTAADDAEAERMLGEAGVEPGQPVVVLNPGANRLDKRWPAERYAAVGDHLAHQRGAAVLVTGAPAEQPILDAVRQAMQAPSHDLQALGVTLRSLKAVLGRADLLITNDTGPRHLGVAMGTAVLALFGPTDPRWTTLVYDRQIELLADPTLGPEERADDHPERCRIDKITVEQVITAAERLFDAGGIEPSI